MMEKFFNIFRGLLTASERDRIDAKFQRIDDKLDHFDDRLDRLEMTNSMQDEKLSSIYSISLANNEALEQKLNRNTVASEFVRQIVDSRMDAFQGSIRNVQDLLSQLINRSS